MPALTALILSPGGRDAAIAARILEDAGMQPVICESYQELICRIGNGSGFAIVTEESFRGADLKPLHDRLTAQDPWSDYPFIVLTRRSESSQRNPATTQLAELLLNVTFLERPFHPATFISLAKTASRSRERQFEARARIVELHERDERLRQANETLETRVAERTGEMQAAHEKLVMEVEQRERTEILLRQAQKMEMIGQLTGGIAHDFNNLLMAVLGNLELLKRHMTLDAKAERLVEGAVKGAQRGAALTQRLLAFARRQELTLAPTNLIELVRGMADLLDRSLGSTIEQHVVLPEGMPLALVDGNQLELALLNLAVNARDAMPDGGSLTIEVDMPKTFEGMVLRSGTYVRLSVSDTGSGMGEETLKRATEPFYSTKGVGKGTGLGLSMIQGLAEQLGGSLRLTSTVGIGTRAELWLPVAASASEVPAARPDLEISAVTGSCRILMVDDDPLISMSTVDMLEDLGHEVVEASSGAKALEILNAGEQFDLMITDFSMPKMNGGLLARAVHELRPSLPILLATGYAEMPSGSEIELPRLGKPYTQAQLAAEIGKLVR
ncbi:putative sensor histidine kinase/response regulator [Aurantimonas manganoxydans SI85-9A1]|uniref:histidine kinase n=1 Tax=Aurantimonas manganoxydans (strain ATCC BAA-1229 / DSM 21871 / SI85-9A1) TaxID=287752 RepID=Q1YGV6_AURMS|nr:ATP-binding protein [Aurantimonas manganoxydans]EAS49823.1 putative sensor histidine kinase/response regulator [Aurantimonas manganoxydans SI85-9A1]